MNQNKFSSAIYGIGKLISKSIKFMSPAKTETIAVFQEYELFKKFEARWVKKRDQLIKSQMLSYFFRLEACPAIIVKKSAAATA